MSKSNRLYSDSPSLTRDEDGEVTVSRPSESAPEVTETVDEPDLRKQLEDLVDRHTNELAELRKRIGESTKKDK